MDFGIQREFWNQSPIDTERQLYNAEGLVAQLTCSIYQKKKVGGNRRDAAQQKQKVFMMPIFYLKKKKICSLGPYPFLPNEPLKAVMALFTTHRSLRKMEPQAESLSAAVSYWPAGLSHQHHCRSDIPRDFLAYYRGIMLVKHLFPTS